MTEAGLDKKPGKGKKTQEEIIGRAMRIAAVEGLGTLSIGRLAKELRMSKSGLFVHFGSKEKLEAAVVARAADIFFEQVVDPVGRRSKLEFDGSGRFATTGWNSWKTRSCRAAISLPEHSLCTRDRIGPFPD